MLISNRETLAVSEGRRLVLDLAEIALRAIDTKEAIKRSVEFVSGHLTINQELVTLVPDGRLLVVAIGKGALDASIALEEILGDQINGGIALDVRGDKGGQLKRIRSLVGDHPFPTARNVEAARATVENLSNLTELDVVIFIISGGGSTLLCLPAGADQPTGGEAAPVTGEAALVKALFKVGATIQELNTVRKHLSLARGGYLAKVAYPATSYSLIFSDVPGDDPAVIASGPTVLDTTRLTDAERVIQKYGLGQLVGPDKIELAETPKDQKYFERIKHLIIVSNKIALGAAATLAGERGYSARIVTDQLAGEAREVGERIAKEIGKAPAKTALLYGGETTVTMANHGEGGRNQELTLAALPYLNANSLLLALASDGRDNSDVAGAIGDIITVEHGRQLNLSVYNYLAKHDSYNFFRQTGDQLQTGPTGANVSDLIIALKN